MHKPVMFPVDAFINHIWHGAILWSDSLTAAYDDLYATYPGAAIAVQWSN